MNSELQDRARDITEDELREWLQSAERIRDSVGRYASLDIRKIAEDGLDRYYEKQRKRRHRSAWIDALFGQGL